MNISIYRCRYLYIERTLIFLKTCILGNLRATIICTSYNLPFRSYLLVNMPSSDWLLLFCVKAPTNIKVGNIVKFPQFGLLYALVDITRLHY